ncbi:MAG: AAA family ATPase, partial [bacterium]
MDDQTTQFKSSDFNVSNNASNGFTPSDDEKSKDTVVSNSVEDTTSEILLLEKAISDAMIPAALKVKTQKMLDRLTRMAKHGSYSGEYELIEKYVEWVTKIPFRKFAKENLAIDNVRKVLDSNHYGMQSVKDRITEYLSVMKLQTDKLTPAELQTKQTSTEDMSVLEGNSSHAPVLCFVGVQGIGKTSLAKSIAQAMNRPFVRVALGAMGSVMQLRGQSRAFMGAEPGQIIKALVKAEVSNPLILLDEIDKVSGEESRRFDFMASLLEILDPEQNGTFLDAYIDYPVDLSKVMFICTANNLGTLSSALLDRLEIIRFSSYTDDEKAHIARDYLLKKVRSATGLDEYQLSFSEDVWPLMIRPLGFDAGIRQLERNLTTIARKVARLIVEGKIQNVQINPKNFREYIPDD